MPPCGGVSYRTGIFMRKRILYAIVVSLVAALALTGAGCSKGAGDSSKGAGGGGKSVAATVNGEEILEAEVDAELERVEKANPGIFEGDEGATRRESERLRIIDIFVQQRIIIQDAIAQGLTVTDDEVSTDFEALKAAYQTPEAWDAALKDANYTEDVLRKVIHDQALVQKLAEKVAESDLAAEPSDEEVQAYYEQNQIMFSTPAERLGRPLLVADEAAARTALERVRGGEDFATVAGEGSEGPGSKSTGGDLGWSDGNSFVEGFRETYQTLPVGEISDLVKTDFGYHIIQILEEREASVMPIDNVREQIVQDIRNTNANATFEAYIDELEAKAEIGVFDTDGKESDPAAVSTPAPPVPVPDPESEPETAN